MSWRASAMLLVACGTSPVPRAEPESSSVVARPRDAARSTRPVYEPAGADRTGVRDSTVAIQTALDQAPSGSMVRLPEGTYRVGNLVLADKRDVEVRGEGAILILHGAAEPGARIGLELRGSLIDVAVLGLHLHGDGSLDSRHAGIWSRSGGHFTRIQIAENEIADVTLGISVNADLSGHLRDVRILDNDIRNIVGTESGYGYGIHVASGQPDPIDALVSDNRITGAQRHAIYQGRGWGSLIRRNVVRDHRRGASTGQIRPAVVIARGGDVRVTENSISHSSDGGVLITAGGHYSARVVVDNNTIADARDSVPPIIVGSQDPALEGSPERVVIEHNRIEQGESSRAESIRVYGVKGLRVADNIFTSSPRAWSGLAVDVRCDCPVVYERNQLR